MKKRALVMLGAAIVLIVCNVLFQMMPLRPVPDCKYASAPILCAELPRDGNELDRVVHAAPNTPSDWSRTTWIDMPFLVAYALLLAGAALGYGRSRSALVVARVAAVLISLAAAFDFVENLGVLQAAEHHVSDALAMQVRFCALAKFSLASASCTIAFGLRAHAATRLWVRALSVLGAIFCAIGVPAIAYEPLVTPSFLGIILSSIVALVETAFALRQR